MFSFLLAFTIQHIVQQSRYMGVWVSVRVNIRVAVAASALNYSDALQLAFRGGAVSSVLSASLCILGVSLLYLSCYIIFVMMFGMPAEQVPLLLAGYGFGASFVALFMQLGGGIYTKAADVGADMVGKIERDIPEDDPRNPVSIFAFTIANQPTNQPTNNNGEQQQTISKSIVHERIEKKTKNQSEANINLIHQLHSSIAQTSQHNRTTTTATRSNQKHNSTLATTIT